MQNEAKDEPWYGKDTWKKTKTEYLTVAFNFLFEQSLDIYYLQIFYVHIILGNNSF